MSLPMSDILHPARILTATSLQPGAKMDSPTGYPYARQSCVAARPMHMNDNPHSPLLSLPPELLGEIFTQAACSNPDAPFALGAVCTAFRRVVRTTPRVWKRLRLTQATLSEGDDKWIMKADLFFKMAGICLVDVDVYIQVSEGNSYVEHNLPHALFAHRHRIRALDLHTPGVNEAAHFFSSVYPAEECSVPLERLTLHAVSESVAPRHSTPLAHLRHSTDALPAPCVSLAHRAFPHLTYISVANQPLPEFICFGMVRGHALEPVDNAANLRTLRVVYPLRFAPLPIERVLQLLQAAPLLEMLEIEARVVVDSDTSASAPENSVGRALIPLPYLTLLSLRINNVPALLARLLTPALTTLRIDDLDGKRAGAAAQTGAVLRQLLVRMEMPLPGERAGSNEYSKGRGLKILDLCGVALAVPGASAAATPHARDEPGEDPGALWAWCARRMRTLSELRVKRVDVNALWELLTPPSNAAPDNVVLPSLKRLIIADAPGIRNVSAFSEDGLFSSGRQSTMAGMSGTGKNMHIFQLRRPDVEVHYLPVHDAGQVPVGIDFLDLYTRH